MRNYIVIHILLFLLLMLVYQCAGAQDYVLTIRGDSLPGDVKPLFYGPEKKVQLNGPDKEKDVFTLFEIRAFSDDGELYHPVKGEKGYVFMKLLRPGYLSLYAYQQENQTRFDGLFLKKRDGENIVVPNLGFRKYLSKFLEDCPEIAAKVKDGDFGKKNMDEMIDAYNACINNRTIDHQKIITTREEHMTRLNAWDSLEEDIRRKDFSDKANALEMIAEIRKKIGQQEKIPNFLVEGLKSSLKDTGLSSALDQALKEIDR